MRDVLRPLKVHGSIFLDLQPWHVVAIESDVLLGRRGQRGWNEYHINWGSLLTRDLSWWERLGQWWHSLDWSNWQTWAYLAGGLAFAAIGIAALALGPLGFILGGAFIGFGLSFGLTGATTHNAGAAVQAGLIGAAAGAVGGAASYGILALFGGTAALAEMGLLAQMSIGTLAGAAGGAAGGFVGGTLGGLVAGQSWREALYSGLEGMWKGALVGAVLGLVGPGLAKVGSYVARAGRQALSFLGRGVQYVRRTGRLLWQRLRGQRSLFDELGIRPGHGFDPNVPSAAGGRSYITYAFRDSQGRVVYVGRASGRGSPTEALAGRIAKGHDHYQEGLSREILSVHGSKVASQGAEEVFVEGFSELGMPLRNIDAPLSFANSARIQKSLLKLEAFFDELH